jgi:methyl-accepting chemotaxis protein
METNKNFAAMAEEIRKLAEKIRKDSDDIAHILNEISMKTEERTGGAEASAGTAGEEDGMMTQASESFDEMNRNVDTLVWEIENISEKLNALSDVNDQMVDDISSQSAEEEEKN